MTKRAVIGVPRFVATIPSTCDECGCGTRCIVERRHKVPVEAAPDEPQYRIQCSRYLTCPGCGWQSENMFEDEHGNYGVFLESEDTI